MKLAEAVPFNDLPQNTAMKKNKPIPLFYWSSKRFEGRPKENYGDILSKYLVEKITGRPVKWIHPKKQPWYQIDKTHYLAVGSILAQATKNSIVWGSGIIDQSHKIASADFRAVRGPRTRNFLNDQGITCPEVFGDPALLLPKFYPGSSGKKVKVGIIPHYVDYERALQRQEQDTEIRVINLLTDNVEATTDDILNCRIILSSSLHGLIVAHAYGIPAVWVKFSDKIFGDDIKYYDYFESISITDIRPYQINGSLKGSEIRDNLSGFATLPDTEIVHKIQNDLMAVCPFKPGMPKSAITTRTRDDR